MPEKFEIISSARDLNDVPRVALMVKKVEESLRRKPKTRMNTLANNQILQDKIRQILSER